MTEFEVWSLVISGFAAVGTVGAVIIALWATLHQRVRFKVKDIRVSSLQTVSKEGAVSPITEAGIYFLIENKLPVQMEMMLGELTFSRKTKKHPNPSMGIGLSLRGQFIPAHSQYEVKFDLKGAEIDIPEDDIGNIICTLKTSAGDETIKFPEKWRDTLFHCLKFKEGAVAA